jgi:hypothetical protein
MNPYRRSFRRSRPICTLLVRSTSAERSSEVTRSNRRSAGILQGPTTLLSLLRAHSLSPLVRKTQLFVDGWLRSRGRLPGDRSRTVERIWHHLRVPGVRGRSQRRLLLGLLRRTPERGKGDGPHHDGSARPRRWDRSCRTPNASVTVDHHGSRQRPPVHEGPAGRLLSPERDLSSGVRRRDLNIEQVGRLYQSVRSPSGSRGGRATPRRLCLSTPPRDAYVRRSGPWPRSRTSKPALGTLIFASRARRRAPESRDRRRTMSAVAASW